MQPVQLNASILSNFIDFSSRKIRLSNRLLARTKSTFSTSLHIDEVNLVGKLFYYILLGVSFIFLLKYNTQAKEDFFTISLMKKISDWLCSWHTL